MPNNHRLRRLVTGDAVHLWSVRHRHSRTGSCEEVLSLYAEGARVPLRLVFREGDGRYVSEALMATGRITKSGGGALNLREPGTVRNLVDAAHAVGLLPGTGETDGWPVFDAVVRSGPWETGP
ncbi:hypothetical protein QIS99_20820 [Streptomyces sp. B-S-A8]|uniref:DUF397 domain-containing protein n=1 Tax=Streptomyces solicavernae TaxID=3043614 RepID=A0ABT6RXY3_9ACTN|nr:hypothetical protein [Streptomyces sp. B-S-A8]MDI3388628.1 hypothetical protein [Streptomyces sp. B-S-A8]